MKILTKKQQHGIAVRLTALLRICMAMAKNLPIEQYPEYLDKFMGAIIDIAIDVGGVDMAYIVEKKGFEE